MKKKKSALLLLLMTSFLLCACDEGGFTAAKPSGSIGNDTSSSDGKNEDNTNQYSGHGSSGSEENPQENQNGNTEEPGQAVGQGGEGEGTKIDLGIQITTFKSVCLKTSEEDYYINVSFDANPFDDKYQFAYYTINDVQLTEEDFQEKEIINEKETYKIYVGSNTSGIYVVKFYNAKNIQYGRTDISVKFKDLNLGKTYISVAFNIVQIRVLSFFYTIKERFDRFIGSFTKDSMPLSR